jgi:hypothetical protein
MRKTPFIIKKAKGIAENSKSMNTKVNPIEIELNNQSLLIATSPRRITLKQAEGSKWITDEHYPQRMILVRNKRYMDESIENESEKNFHTSFSMMRDDFEETESNSDLEEFDISLGKTRHRIFFNKLENKIWGREIVYDENGNTLFVNPVDIPASKQLQKIFIELNLPRNKRLDTITHFKQKVEKFYKEEELKSQPKKKPVGNQQKPSLIRAALWCINNHPENLRYKRQTILRAYKKFGEKTHKEESFIKSVSIKWNNVIKNYGRQTDEFKKQNSLKSYAKSELKIPRTDRKQSTKENEKTFN